MDEGLSKAVLKVFVDLHAQGLIYKDKRLVNWDPEFQSAISDLEVEMLEVKGSFNWTAGDPDKPFDAKALGKALDRNPSGHLYHFKYPLKDDPDEVTSSSRRRDPRRCWATRRLPCTPRMRATRTSSASRWCCRWSGARSRSSPTSTPTPRRARAR